MCRATGRGKARPRCHAYRTARKRWVPQIPRPGSFRRDPHPNLLTRKDGFRCSWHNQLLLHRQNNRQLSFRLGMRTPTPPR